MAGRQPIRLLARQLRAQPSHSCPRQPFSSMPARLVAQNFSMPAMSPTMTEGNITSWNVKEGDAFSTGDVLLEIETDKASMDVEAQDDGIVAKIFSPDGTKAVKVGTRIAVLAEPGDDISSIEIPADDSKPVQSAADNVKGGDDSSYTTSGIEKEVKGTPQNKRPSRDKAKSSPKGPGQNPKYPLYPSVIALVHENHLSDSDVAKIPATGPNNRLLKGDVLAFLGQIDADYSANASKTIEHRGHLDLSDIKILRQEPKAPTAAKDAEQPQIPAITSISLPISLSEVLKVQKRIQDTLGVSMPISTFLSRAVDIANDDLPKPKASQASADELFNAVLGLSAVPTTSRGTYLPQIDALPSTSMARVPTPRRILKQPDIIDILSGRVRPASRRMPSELLSPGGGSVTTSAGALNIFSVTVPVGEEKRARTFLERMKTVLQVEPGRLVL